MANPWQIPGIFWKSLVRPRGAAGQYERARRLLEHALPHSPRSGRSPWRKPDHQRFRRVMQQALAYYKQALIISEEIPEPKDDW